MPKCTRQFSTVRQHAIFRMRTHDFSTGWNHKTIGFKRISGYSHRGETRGVPCGIVPSVGVGEYPGTAFASKRGHVFGLGFMIRLEIL